MKQVEKNLHVCKIWQIYKCQSLNSCYVTSIQTSKNYNNVIVLIISMCKQTKCFGTTLKFKKTQFNEICSEYVL